MEGGVAAVGSGRAGWMSECCNDSGHASKYCVTSDVCSEGWWAGSRARRLGWTEAVGRQSWIRALKRGAG